MATIARERTKDIFKPAGISEVKAKDESIAEPKYR